MLSNRYKNWHEFDIIVSDMKRLTISILSILGFAYVQAQTGPGDSTKNSVIVHKDPRVDLLVNKENEINQEVYLSTKHTLQGFRVQVTNTNDRSKALAVKTKLLQEFPDESTYLIYQSPYFKIQIGNCKTHKDAEDLKKLVNKFYPADVFIVPAVIEIKPGKDDEVSQ
ncbi:MAG: sporulation protein [Bacteroidetes bacterium]|nr:MAG: sporulation protein [Bacteroidota bacterium]